MPGTTGLLLRIHCSLFSFNSLGTDITNIYKYVVSKVREQYNQAKTTAIETDLLVLGYRELKRC